MLSRCIVHSMSVRPRNRTASGAATHGPQHWGSHEACNQRRQRRVAAERRHGEPDDAKDDCRGPGEPKQDADIGRHAFAALEFQPDRKEVPQERPEPLRRMATSRLKSSQRHKDRDRAFEHVAEERRRRERFPPSAKAHWWRRYCPNRLERMSCAPARRVSDQPEWDRAEQIAEEETQPQRRRGTPIEGSDMVSPPPTR